eukprot:COSAG06_NODE_3283_length_5558_cov_2.577761_9_plen_109_part_00
MAGGGPTAGVESGEYNLTEFAKQGDLGIHLPEVHGATWKAGGTAETAWYIRANHGGGYVRKAPAEQQIRYQGRADAACDAVSACSLLLLLLLSCHGLHHFVSSYLVSV